MPGKFATANQHACVKCALRANEGHLYPLEKQFIFIHKPAVLIRFDEIESVEFQRFSGNTGSTRNFDLCVSLISSGTGELGATKEYVFSGIDRSDYAALYSFLSSKRIRIKNIQGSMMEAEGTGQPRYDERERAAAAEAHDDDEESSEDDDYNSEDVSGDGDSKDSEEISDDADEDEDEGEDDSDLEEYRKAAKKASSKGASTAEKKRKTPESKAKSTKKAKESNATDKKQKKKRAKKDPNAPKRPTTAYFYFMNENRARIKKENPSVTFGEIGKLLGEQYKKLSAAEKKKYEDLAAEDKKRYKKEMDLFQLKAKDTKAPSNSKGSDKDDDDDDEDSASDDSD